jgi:putative glycosyltransferase (TIGR04372 family)
MQHLDVRLGVTRYLLCDPQTTPDGRPAGYGNMLRNAEQAIRTAASLGAVLHFIPSGRPINAALFDLESPDVRILSQSDWRAAALRAVFRLGKPFRYGAAAAWLASATASMLRPAVHPLMHFARRRGWRTVDRKIDRFGHACRRVANAYEHRVNESWRTLFAEARARARATDSKRQAVRLRLRPDAQARVDALAAQAGLDQSRPIVVLHVRESGYRQRGAPRQQVMDRIRDAQIETYRPAIAWLVEQGYQVVRIGDPTMTPCAWPGVIDLATAPWRTGEFELWAALRSRFLITGDSGPYYLAQLVSVPALSVNVVRVGYNTIQPGDRYISKLVFDRSRGRSLSMVEMLSDEFAYSPVDFDRYAWVDNTADDIRDAVEDMVAAVNDLKAPRTPEQCRHDEVLSQLAPRKIVEGRARASLLARRGGRGTVSPRFAARYLDSTSADRLERGPRMR